MEKVTSLSVERENVGCFHVRELVGRLSEWQINLTSARDSFEEIPRRLSQLLTWIAIRLLFHSSIQRIVDYHSAGLACGY